MAALLARHLRGDGGHGLPRRQQRPLRVRHLHPEQAPAAHFSGTAVCMQCMCRYFVSCFCCQLPHLDHHAGRPGAGLHLRGGGEQAAHRGARHRVPGSYQQVPSARDIVSNC